MLFRCNFGDVPPRVDAVKIYKNVGPEDQVITLMPACATLAHRLLHMTGLRIHYCGGETAVALAQ